MEPRLPVTVVAVRPSAVYQGRVYTHSASVRLENGPDFDVYDPRKLLSLETDEEPLTLGLRLLYGEVTEYTEPEKGVRFDAEGRPVFRGEVVGGDDDRALSLLDVGSGTVELDLARDQRPPSLGASISVSRTPIHVRHVPGNQ
jgi:hypothetical protein